MLHIFVINPVSGKLDSSEILKQEIISTFERLEIDQPYEIHVTTKSGDAEEYVRNRCKTLNKEAIFYACGGDGTCNEVLNGLMKCKYARMAIVPVGSCNDFLRIYPLTNRYHGLASLVQGHLVDIDVIKVNDRYVLNVFNVGYDAYVNDDCNKMAVKSKNISTAYRLAIMRNLITNFSHKMRLEISDEEPFEVEGLLLACANGSHYGNGINCAPYADIKDGLFELVFCKKTSRLTFIKAFKHYKNGRHLEHKKYKKHFIYRQIKSLKISSDKPICVCLDGEIFFWSEIEVSIVAKGLKMLFPYSSYQ